MATGFRAGFITSRALGPAVAQTAFAGACAGVFAKREIVDGTWIVTIARRRCNLSTAGRWLRVWPSASILTTHAENSSPLIRFYQLTISPLLSILGGPGSGCRFEPTAPVIFRARNTRHYFRRLARLETAARCQPWGGCQDGSVPKEFALETLPNRCSVNSGRCHLWIEPRGLPLYFASSVWWRGNGGSPNKRRVRGRRRLRSCLPRQRRLQELVRRQFR